MNLFPKISRILYLNCDFPVLSSRTQATGVEVENTVQQNLLMNGTREVRCTGSVKSKNCALTFANYSAVAHQFTWSELMPLSTEI